MSYVLMNNDEWLRLRDRPWVRIPLRGNPEGIVVVLPPSGVLTEDDWERMVDILGVMKVGLVHVPTADADV